MRKLLVRGLLVLLAVALLVAGVLYWRQRPVDVDAARLGDGGKRRTGRRFVGGERGALRCGHLLAGDHEVVGAGEGLVKGG